MQAVNTPFRTAVYNAFQALLDEFGMRIVEHDESWLEIKGPRLNIHLTYDRGDVECAVTIPDQGIENVPLREVFHQISKEPEPAPPANLWALPDVLNWYVILLRRGVLPR